MKRKKHRGPRHWGKGKKPQQSLHEPNFIDDMDDDYEDGSETLSAYDAALIWGSSGMDEDYMFDYSEEELLDSLK